TAEVYDENQKGLQVHMILWIVLSMIVALILGIYALFEIANTKDSLLYSKISTSNTTK
ncbi:conserved protein, unknown function, partial [Hepatocystis sp. ex Piliocolobus tephrosceles]